ncbi:Hypp5485 [Branchiostoma lanceolatum]|uniref:Hypp5485 protein n=1 Tax=Branchiostoma lanceolatum TaxID=7740 RepID=A0A8J9VD61_BRALA|nr:Hypp5485 [Branchiostoma lanceolatum]
MACFDWYNLCNQIDHKQPNNFRPIVDTCRIYTGRSKNEHTNEYIPYSASNNRSYDCYNNSWGDHSGWFNYRADKHYDIVFYRDINSEGEYIGWYKYRAAKYIWCYKNKRRHIGRLFYCQRRYNRACFDWYNLCNQIDHKQPNNFRPIVDTCRIYTDRSKYEHTNEYIPYSAGNNRSYDCDINSWGDHSDYAGNNRSFDCDINSWGDHSGRFNYKADKHYDIVFYRDINSEGEYIGWYKYRAAKYIWLDYQRIKNFSPIDYRFRIYSRSSKHDRRKNQGFYNSSKKQAKHFDVNPGRDDSGKNNNGEGQHNHGNQIDHKQPNNFRSIVDACRIYTGRSKYEHTNEYIPYSAGNNRSFDCDINSWGDHSGWFNYKAHKHYDIVFYRDINSEGEYIGWYKYRAAKYIWLHHQRIKNFSPIDYRFRIYRRSSKHDRRKNQGFYNSSNKRAKHFDVNPGRDHIGKNNNRDGQHI